jgi:hypothetical protein
MLLHSPKVSMLPQLLRKNPCLGILQSRWLTSSVLWPLSINPQHHTPSQKLSSSSNRRRTHAATEGEFIFCLLILLLFVKAFHISQRQVPGYQDIKRRKKLKFKYQATNKLKTPNRILISAPMRQFRQSLPLLWFKSYVTVYCVAKGTASSLEWRGNLPLDLSIKPASCSSIKNW